MRLSGSLLIAGCGLLFAALGCSHLDLSSGEGDPNRVFTGTVNAHMSLIPPADAKLVVRVVEPQDVVNAETAPTNNLVIGERGTQLKPERVLGEQVISAPSELPVPFHIECRVSDATMRRGVNIEARLSWGGKLRFRTVQAQAVTLSSAGSQQMVWIEAAQ